MCRAGMMKLDARQLRADADAHDTRIKSSLWTDPDGDKDKPWTASVTAGEPADEGVTQSQPIVQDAAQDLPVPDLLPRLEALDRNVEMLTKAVNRRPVGSEAVPDWLQTAAGDPHTYDSPDSTRRGVCVRILPTTYNRVELAQRGLGLRTKAGAWEYLLRLGLAAAERLPTR
jgi:hypothetical protein